MICNDICGKIFGNKLYHIGFQWQDNVFASLGRELWKSPLHFLILKKCALILKNSNLQMSCLSV